ncbi:hypothetical protein [Actinokineospora inagensis]|uniref:hypothetical protein n=1 Tax=Actinokineospora inagensis TaxID=103730 RepID=UPI0004209C8D|nr:hypothetical protein [Actinokineospora inagensis]
MTGIDVGRGRSVWWLRGVTGLACAGILGDLVANDVATIMFGVAVLLSAACVFLPASPAPLVLIGLAALITTVAADDPLRPAVLVLIPLVHALHLSCAVTGLLPRGARFDPRALRPMLVRAAWVQGVVFAIAGVVALLPVVRTPEPVELIALLSIAGLALLVIGSQRSRR